MKQKAQCDLWFDKTRLAITVQRNFSEEYRQTPIRVLITSKTDMTNVKTLAT